MIKNIGLVLVLLIGLGAGFWFGQQNNLHGGLEGPAVKERKLLYYRHPMNPQVTSPEPAKDEMGMDYIAIYDEPLPTEAVAVKSGKILYYRHPMGAADTSLVPKKDEMGMDYLISKRNLSRDIRALGSIQIDESHIKTVSAKYEGWIQHLVVSSVGQAVKAGQVLFNVYSPELITAQQEYVVAIQSQKALQQGSPQVLNTADQLAKNALQRLRYWDLGANQLKNLQDSQKPLDSVPFISPYSGVVLDKTAQEGLRFMPGELLFRVADLSTVWLLADVFEQDLEAVRVGQSVQVHINAYPDKNFTGKVSFIYPTLATETRTVKVRVELANKEGLLKPGLYGTLILTSANNEKLQTAVPDSAVIDTGTRHIVLLSRGEGRFEPRVVKLGGLANGYYAVLAGLEEGDEVVTHANFLIDAESNLKAALDGMNAPESAPDSEE
ncbi:MAG: efflux RND transporter periplasmic adaptor subunit [Methylococcales bacterium]|nr:efflux RND transporter periplasmic adaptor subunit [Methylococcales bacterium]